MSSAAQLPSPKARKVTAKQRLFAEAMLSTKGNKSRSAMLSGTPKISARVAGHRMANLPQVRALLRELVDEHLTLGSLAAVHTLVKLAGNARSEYVMLEAARDVLDRNAIGTGKTGAAVGGLIVNISLHPIERGPIEVVAEGAGLENARPVAAKPPAHMDGAQKLLGPPRSR